MKRIIADYRGFSMIEVLVTIVILAIGLLGLAALQVKTQNVEMESYQRTQALVILNDMVNRIQVNRDNADSYVGDVNPTAVQNCSGLSGAGLDLCDWSNALLGAAESSGGTQVGAMIGARGCIQQIQAPNSTAGSCTPGIWEVSVAWQGMFNTASPSNDCGTGQYGNDTLRRVIAMRISAGTTGCT